MDDDEQKYPSQLAERFQVRLPVGLRDRIKAYAERHGRSMNTEIVRVLEREFPEQWPVETRLNDLAEMMAILTAGASDSRIDEVVSKFEETVEGIVSGRVTGVDLETRESIMGMWQAYRSREDEKNYEAAQEAMTEYDDEEQRSLELTGRSEKFALPPPRRKEWGEMSEEEQDRHIKEQLLRENETGEQSKSSDFPLPEWEP
ncbi:DNA-binding protein [Mesorhizobium sp. L103C119B0]|uniref:Arc family DNA-binding protein n=1 Tax=Mesorhizobium sp. L103C119B0 TaxID=1287085 RepID=UPI0003D00DE2|nr:Arc family DNA-binding protein [Mesorhizobium sp. L103C119B0]ESZ70585.1 DNA-binding protein [Mesorhizobium sp. L103C119B0]